MRIGLAAGVAALTVGLLAAPASAAIAPADVAVSGAAGQTVSARFALDATPALDIELALDTTASLGDTLKEASDEAPQIVHDIQTRFPDARFAVAQFKDAGFKPEYRVEQSMTADAGLVAKAVARLSSSGGGDMPEAYNVVFDRSVNPAVGGPTGWRSDARKIVVVIGDAEPHGAGTAGVPGCEDTSADPHHLDTAAVLAALPAAGRTLVMVHQVDHNSMLMDQMPASFECYQGLAKVAGGIAVEGDLGHLHDSIVGAVTGAVAPAPDGAELGLRVAGASPRPAAATWAALTSGGTALVVSVAIPPGTRAGTYVFDLVETVGGSDSSHATLAVTVKAPKKPCKPAKKGHRHATGPCVKRRRRHH
jgi:hypothetical protein